MNCKPPELVDRFIELRAKGVPYSAIAEELGVRKATLIDWSRKHQHRIHNLRVLEAESLTHKYSISRQACLEGLGEDIQRIRAEIAKRDLTAITTPRLYTMAAMLRSEAVRLTAPVTFMEPLPPDPADPDELVIPHVDWKG